MNIVEILNIKGDNVFNKDHKVFLIKNNKLHSVFVRKANNNSVDIITNDETINYSLEYIGIMSNYEKAKAFDLIFNTNNENVFLVSDEIKVFVLDVEHIYSEVCKYYGFLVSEIKNNRLKHYVWIRYVAMRLSKQYTKRTLQYIGEKICDRDHTTVLYGCKKVDNFIKIYKDRNKQLEELRDILRSKYKILVDNG